MRYESFYPIIVENSFQFFFWLFDSRYTDFTFNINFSLIVKSNKIGIYNTGTGFLVWKCKIFIVVPLVIFILCKDSSSIKSINLILFNAKSQSHPKVQLINSSNPTNINPATVFGPLIFFLSWKENQKNK